MYQLRPAGSPTCILSWVALACVVHAWLCDGMPSQYEAAMYARECTLQGLLGHGVGGGLWYLPLLGF